MNLYTVKDNRGRAVLKGSQLYLVGEVAAFLNKKYQRPYYIMGPSNTVISVKI